MKKLLIAGILSLSSLTVSAAQNDVQVDINKFINASNVVENPFHADSALEYRFVNADNLNVRDYPVTGNVVGQLSRGEQVGVYAVSDSWVQISSGYTDSKWVSAAYLCEGAGCFERPTKTTKNQRTANQSNSGSQPKNTTTKKSSAPKRTYSDGLCPCSGSYNCTGPRGGQYCITSGGNKRYR